MRMWLPTFGLFAETKTYEIAKLLKDSVFCDTSSLSLLAFYMQVPNRAVTYNTLRAESFAGRKFREDGKSRNFANLTFANTNFRVYFTDKTRESSKNFTFGGKNFE